MHSKLWLIFALLALAMVVESTTFEDASWGLTNFGHGIEYDTDMLLDTEINRRQLAQRSRYISYGALKRNAVPCNRRGQSYYNCNKRQKVNPYTRGCSVITHCQRFTG
ncbi:RALF domain-containing protein [Cephalotus follicularis]|uniref:RALF domain-containing protein n=1 Tax=Cephalotus follicularis TaxID=3775 RepID=A0A1Q3BF98_CEPFO|nr:RALF domain-containing protein [Cephalotus follicularis]